MALTQTCAVHFVSTAGKKLNLLLFLLCVYVRVCTVVVGLPVAALLYSVILSFILVAITMWIIMRRKKQSVNLQEGAVQLQDLQWKEITTL